MATDVTNWVGTGITALVALGGVAAYLHKHSESVQQKTETRIDKIRSEVNTEIDEESKEIRNWVKELKSESDKERERIWRAIEGFSQVAMTVTGLARSVDSLAERFSDYRETQNRDIDEIKHSIRNMSAKMDGIAAVQARREGIIESG